MLSNMWVRSKRNSGWKWVSTQRKFSFKQSNNRQRAHASPQQRKKLESEKLSWSFYLRDQYSYITIDRYTDRRIARKCPTIFTETSCSERPWQRTTSHHQKALAVTSKTDPVGFQRKINVFTLPASDLLAAISPSFSNGFDSSVIFQRATPNFRRILLLLSLLLSVITYAFRCLQHVRHSAPQDNHHRRRRSAPFGHLPARCAYVCPTIFFANRSVARCPRFGRTLVTAGRRETRNRWINKKTFNTEQRNKSGKKKNQVIINGSLITRSMATRFGLWVAVSAIPPWIHNTHWRPLTWRTHAPRQDYAVWKCGLQQATQLLYVTC